MDQYAVEQNSFVYSVPFDVGGSVDPLVTATHAVFIEHKGHRAPAAVVGLQYQHSHLVAHFHNITSTVISTATYKTVIVVLRFWGNTEPTTHAQSMHRD